jgi:hypothetical protein
MEVVIVKPQGNLHMKIFDYRSNFQKLLPRLQNIGPSNKYIFRVGVGDILILLTV